MFTEEQNYLLKHQTGYTDDEIAYLEALLERSRAKNTIYLYDYMVEEYNAPKIVYEGDNNCQFSWDLSIY